MRDVAIIFHAHCLSPHRYYQDMFHRGRNLIFWNKGVDFPLEALYELIAAGVWSDASSQRAWEGLWPDSPYQLWEVNPEKGESLQLQDIRWLCPWCEKSVMLNLTNFTEMYVNKSCHCTCVLCRHVFDADSLSAKYLIRDLLEFQKTRDIWYVLPPWC